MKRSATMLSLVLLTCACGTKSAQQPSSKLSTESATVIKCSHSGLEVHSKKSGSETTELRKTDFYRISTDGSSIERFDQKDQEFGDYCHKDHKCTLKIDKSRILITDNMVVPGGMIISGDTDIDRISGDFRQRSQVKMFNIGQSISQSTSGKCVLSDAPAAIF